VKYTPDFTSSSNTVDEDVQDCVTMGNFRTCDIISSAHEAIADTHVPQPVAEGI